MKRHIFIVLLITNIICVSQSYMINWDNPVPRFINGSYQTTLNFDGITFSNFGEIGCYSLVEKGKVESLKFSEIQYIKCTSEENKILEKRDIPNNIAYKLEYARSRNEFLTDIFVCPVIKGKDGKIYKLSKFKIAFKKVIENNGLKLAGSEILESSVLANGDWFKLSVENSGIYKLDYNFLNQMGISPSNVNPKTLQIFGFGGMLPEANSAFRYNDLPEIAMQFMGNSDEKFDNGEYFLVFLQGANIEQYKYSLTLPKNIYSDKAYYFLTHSQNAGQRIVEKTQFINYDKEIRNYDFIIKHEKDLVSLIHSGRDWVGESLVNNSSQSFNVSLPELDPNTQIRVSGVIQGSNVEPTTCKINFNGSETSYSLPNKDVSVTTFNNTQVRTISFYQNQLASNFTNNYTLGFNYTKSSISNKTHIDYFQITGKAKMRFTQNYLLINQVNNSEEFYQKFKISTPKPDVSVWDVSAIGNIRSVPINVENADSISFIDTLNAFAQYAIVDLTGSFGNPNFESKVKNQNLHGLGTPELLIITNNSLINEANRLAEFRRTHNGYTVEVAKVEDIYNEFASGSSDMVSIRDFVKYRYDKDPDKLKWVLLFGACSYDYKNRIPNNTNIVPIYETPESAELIDSYSSDDFMGLLDPEEGGDIKSGKLDVSVGRLPVKNIDDATLMVDKIIHYTTAKVGFDKWKNSFTFVCDDGDNNLHMKDAEKVSSEVFKNNKALKINKLYLPLFPEISSPTGQISPNLNNRLTEELNKGTLVLNYSGHGREIGWASENIVTLDYFKSLRNYDRLFFMITATCEFGRYDDPEIESGVLAALLNSRGGAIATLGATRPVFASSNSVFNVSIMNLMYSKAGGRFNTLGELNSKSKNAGGDPLVRNYGLLGDPSMPLEFPKYEINIDSITNIDRNQIDTLKALSKVRVKGSVVNNGNLISGFNGNVVLTLFDKEFSLLSKIDSESDPNADQLNIKVRESIIYQGKASVKNGKFELSFIIPKDISYLVGSGLILTYAKDDSSTVDASGGDIDFLIGDSQDDAQIETISPKIDLYVNDSTFLDGGLMGANMSIIAKISDESGINLSRSGIGHEITLTIDGNTKEAIILNDYYISDENSFNSGSIIYPLYNLSPGLHTITLKVWDVNNNSSTKTITVKVTDKGEIVIGVLDNIPDPDDDFNLFEFSHNRAGEDLSASIQIFDSKGVMVRELFSDINNAQATVKNIQWQTKINHVQYNISSGIYVYRLLLKSNNDGSATSKVEKLVFIK